MGQFVHTSAPSSDSWPTEQFAQEVCWISAPYVPGIHFLHAVRPFLWLARKLVGNATLEFVAAPALAPPTATVDAELLAQYQQEMNDAAQMPLPDEDDADL